MSTRLEAAAVQNAALPPSQPQFVSLPPVVAGAGNGGFGDMILPNVMGVSSPVAIANFSTSQSGQSYNAWLGTTSGRVSTSSYGVGESYLRMFTMHLLFQTHLGVGVGQANGVPGIGSPRVPLISPFLPGARQAAYQPE